MSPLKALAVILATIALFAACAGQPPTPPRELGQGAFRPAPPPFNPAQDAPHTIGQPGHVQPRINVEPGPTPTRVLPQTPESRRGPGLWASTPTDPRPEPQLIGIVLPYPDTAATDDEKRPTQSCARVMNEAIARLTDLGTLPPAPADMNRACAAALLYQKCMIEGAKAAKHGKESGTAYDTVVYGAFARALQKANAFQMEMCPPGVVTDDIGLYVSAVVNEWMRYEHARTTQH